MVIHQHFVGGGRVTGGWGVGFSSLVSKFLVFSSCLFDLASLEFLLKFHPNGGFIIFLRSLWTATFIFLCGLLLVSLPVADWPLAWSSEEFGRLLSGNVGWLGATFAATYAGFYARYAGQWSYLANLYNQIMAARASAPDRNLTVAMIRWQVGFIADAVTLHLYRKTLFSGVIKSMLELPEIRAEFEQTFERKVAGKIIRELGLDSMSVVNHSVGRPFSIERIDHVVFRVVDMARSTAFYQGVLGCVVVRERPDLGLVHLRAGASMIDLVSIEGKLGSRSGAAAGKEGRNVDHLCLRVEPFDEVAIIAHLAGHGVAAHGPAKRNFGAEGEGLSLYLSDPDGNVIELKGPSAA